VPLALPADIAPAVLTLARLRWSVAAEAVLAVAVLAVTAVLVNTPTGGKLRAAGHLGDGLQRRPRRG
jgi:hypothetical protein